MMDKLKALVLWLRDRIVALVERLDAILRGEPVRAIGYGAAVVIYLVARASGKIADVSWPEAVGQATAAVAILASILETIRHFVWSPASVATLTGARSPVSPQ